MDDDIKKIMICGSRSWNNDKKIRELIESLHENTIVYHGGAYGADSIAEKYCHYNNIQTIIIKPINPSNKLDYLFRNIEMITLTTDGIYAFWDGKSKGTKFVIDYATSRNKKVVLCKD